MRSKPRSIRSLWAIWLPHGGADGKGCYMQTGEGTVNDIQCFFSKKDAQYYLKNNSYDIGVNEIAIVVRVK